jgi:hypothetical protein
MVRIGIGQAAFGAPLACPERFGLGGKIESGQKQNPAFRRCRFILPLHLFI